MTLEQVQYVKDYQNKAIMESHVANNLDSREIGNLYNVSHKLVNLWLLQHGLIRQTSELALP